MRPHLPPELLDLVTANSPAVATDLVEPMAQFMITARAVCGGDPDKILLMLVIALRSNAHPAFKAGDPAALADGSGALPSLGTNMRSLAESTGIPRETARRKLRELVEMGWVVQKGPMLHYSATAYQAVEPVRAAIIRMAVASYQVISGLTAREAGAAGAP